MSLRHGDCNTSQYFRTDRICTGNGLFYFSTREGTLEGPYQTRAHAEVACAIYIRDHQDPTRIASARVAPDEHYYRYVNHSME